MITVAVDTVNLSSGSLVLGCVVKGPEGCWVRFAIAEVPLDLFDGHLLANIVDAHDRALRKREQAESLF